MSYETMNVSVELLNQSFVDKVFDQGMIKEAQESASLFIRNKLYEDGILRRLFDPRTVTADELDPLMDSDTPSIICEIEPDAPRATFVPFKGTGDRTYFTGKRFRVPFGKVESERISKSKFELMTIRMPITDWLKEHQVKAIQQQEDELFFGTIADIITTAGAAQGATSSASDGFKEAFKVGLQGLTKLRLPVYKVLMHKNTYLDSLSLKTDEIGHVPQEERFRRGVDGEESFMGFPVVTTIKDEIVKENELFFFAPQDYFSKFFLLQDATLFLKAEADMITFHTYEAPGFGIGNTKGVFKVTIS